MAATAATTAATIAAKVSTGIATTKAVVGTISDLVAAINDLCDRNISALTAYTKRTLITSRVYVEESIATEDIVPKLLKMLNSMYTGFVLAAIGIGNIIASSKTIREMTNAIATENLISLLDDIKNNFGDLPVYASLEDNNQKSAPNEDEQKGGKYITVNEKELKTESSQLFTGRLLQVNIATGVKGESIPLYFYVQLLPLVIPEIVMNQFLSTSTSPSLSLRWAMWKAGEISFWKDFIGEADRVAKRTKALKADKDGILREIEDHKQKQFWRKIWGLFDKKPRHNDANSIVICTQSTMDKVCRELGINMKNYAQRQSMMNSIMAVMICVVDTNYGTVNLYMNGIEARGEYSSKMIESATKSKDPFDIKDLLQLISAGSMPRF